MKREEIIARINEIERLKKEEYKDHADFCRECGWPDHGSNYELMCGQTNEYYEGELNELYDLLK